MDVGKDLVIQVISNVMISKLSRMNAIKEQVAARICTEWSDG